jgi:hypothetical protein
MDDDGCGVAVACPVGGRKRPLHMSTRINPAATPPVPTTANHLHEARVRAGGPEPTVARIGAAVDGMRSSYARSRSLRERSNSSPWSVIGQCLSKLHLRAVQPACNGSRRDCQHRGDLSLGVAVDSVQQQCGAVLAPQAPERLAKVGIVRINPGLPLGSLTEQGHETTAATPLVEGQAQADGVEPGPNIPTVETLPGSEGT